MATEAQIIANRKPLRGVTHLPIYSFTRATNYAKQTQFPKGQNEYKLNFDKGL